MSVCAHGEHRRVGYPPMDFHYDAMTLATGGDFYRIYPLTSRPSRVAAASSIECYFHPAARRWHGKVWFRRKGKPRRKLENIGKCAETNRWQGVGNFEREANLKYREIESINLSEKLRNEIKLFSCDFYDMYPLRSKCCFYPNAGRQYGDAILLRKRNFVKYWRILQEMQQRRDSEIEGQTFSKDDENGALRELSRFVTLKDFEGNRHYLIAVSVEWILQFCHSQYRWFRSKRYFQFDTRQ